MKKLVYLPLDERPCNARFAPMLSNGKSIRVDFCKFIRDEVKFSSIDALAAEIKKNIAQIREYFGGAGL